MRRIRSSRTFDKPAVLMLESSSLSVRGTAAFEYWTLNAPPLAGVALRYGQLYGPGTGVDAAAGPIPLHVDAAAYAAILSIDKGAPGIFNIVEPKDHVATEKAAAELGWHADFRLPCGAFPIARSRRPFRASFGNHGTRRRTGPGLPGTSGAHKTIILAWLRPTACARADYGKVGARSQSPR
jgi:hypothetical protein